MRIKADENGKNHVRKIERIPMNRIYIQYQRIPLGELILGAYQDKLCLCDWRQRKRRVAIDNRLTSGLGAHYHHAPHPIISQAVKQLDAYISLQKKQFTLPLLAVGTDFQKTVWQALQSIEYGTTSTYRRLAIAIGRPKAVRAVANAIGANAMSIFIPCHRIVGHSGRLAGYAGGVGIQEKLLSLENS